MQHTVFVLSHLSWSHKSASDINAHRFRRCLLSTWTRFWLSRNGFFSLLWWSLKKKVLRRHKLYGKVACIYYIPLSFKFLWNVTAKYCKSNETTCLLKTTKWWKCVKTSDVYLKQTSGIVRPLRSVSSTVTALCINFLTRYWLYTLKYSHLTSVKNLLIKLPSQDYSTPCAFSSHNSKYHI